MLDFTYFLNVCAYSGGHCFYGQKKFMFFNILSSFMWAFLLIFAGHYLYGIFLEYGIDLKNTLNIL